MATGSFRVGIGVRLDSDSNTDPDLLSESGEVDSAKSSSESSTSIGGVAGFAFRWFGGLEGSGGSVDRFGCWGGGVGYC